MNDISDHPVAQVYAAMEGVIAAETQLNQAVLRARRAGLSWQKIGTLFGISRQSAWERWSHLEKERH